MSHKLSLDGNSIAISYYNVGIDVGPNTNIFSFGERILLDFDTRDAGL